MRVMDVSSVRAGPQPVAKQILDFLTKERPTWLLVSVSLAVSASYASTLFDVSFLTGSSSYWNFPKGTLPNSSNDMASWLVGYLQLMKTPWSFPLLSTPNLNYPDGLVTFWCDPLPWLALAGRAIYTTSGAVVNLAGPYLLACFLMNGLAMTVLLITAGQRTLLAALVGSLQAIATPFFLFRWGHITLMGQYTVIGALSLYIYSVRNPYRLRITACWFALLTLALLTTPYLLVMCAAIWLSSIYRPARARLRSPGGIATEIIGFSGWFLLILYVLGALDGHVASASAPYGLFSFNLLSPFIPQRSGVFWPASLLYIGSYEGFAYVGVGMLLLVAYCFRYWAEWIRTSWRRHASIAVAFAVLFALAASNHVYVGSWEVLSIELPPFVSKALGVFRASGRFVWPMGYALVAGTLVLVLRRLTRPVGVLILLSCTVLQLIDVEPLRASIAASVRDDAVPLLDEKALSSLTGTANAVLVFPSFACVERLGGPFLRRRDLRTANMELQLIAARNDKPINSVYTGRDVIDCANEDALRRSPLQPGLLYVYLDNELPQTGDAGGSCHAMAGFSYCAVRSEPGDAAGMPPAGPR